MLIFARQPSLLLKRPYYLLILGAKEFSAAHAHSSSCSTCTAFAAPSKKGKCLRSSAGVDICEGTSALHTLLSLTLNDVDVCWYIHLFLLMISIPPVPSRLSLFHRHSVLTQHRLLQTQKVKTGMETIKNATARMTGRAVNGFK